MRVSILDIQLPIHLPDVVEVAEGSPPQPGSVAAAIAPASTRARSSKQIKDAGAAGR